MKKIIFSLFLILLGVICGLTSYKVIKENNEKKLLVSEKRIIAAAQKCWETAKCEGNKVTLEKLYAEDLLKEEINPVTKEIYNVNSYVLKTDNNYQFKTVN